MTTGNTSLLKLALPVEGELAGTWGDVVNNSITSLLDTAVAGATVLSSDSDVTLTDTANAANQARQAMLIWTASGTTTRTITAPARSKVYVVINATGSTQSIKLVGAGPTTGITVVAGEKCLAAWNGSDFVKVSTSVADGVTSVAMTVPSGLSVSGSPITSTGTLAVTTTLSGIVKGTGSGFTTATSGTDYAPATTGAAILYGNGSGGFSNVTIGSNLTFVGGALSAAAPGTGTVTSVALSGGTTGLTVSGSPITSSGTMTLAGTLATANGGTGNTNGTVAKLATTNFSIEESGGKLVFKYGSTVIASMDSSGNITTLANVTAYGTP